MPVKVLKLARSLDEGWENFRMALNSSGPPMPPSVEAFARDAYYVGAATLWDLVMHAPEMDPSDEDDSRGQQLLSRIQDELEGYAGAKAAIVFPVKGRPS